MTPRRRYPARGSVILIAVGILSILAMVGTTFIIVAYTDRRESDSLVKSAAAKKVALGVLTKVQAVLIEDLCFNPSWVGESAQPYEDARSWPREVDAPCTGADRWLASTAMTDLAGGQRGFRRISDLYEAPGNYDDLPATVDPTPDTPAKVGNDWYVDTDGDGRLDAILVDIGTRDPLGNHYYVAVRIIDLCGLINVNTVYRPDDDPDAPGAPAAVPPFDEPYGSRGTMGLNVTDVNGTALGLDVEKLHEKRSRPHTDFPVMPIATYWFLAGRCLLNQMTPRATLDGNQSYLPLFDLDDQLALLWRETDNRKATYTARGRLVDVIGEANFRALRPFLTTYNYARPLRFFIPRMGPERRYGNYHQCAQTKRANLNTADFLELFHAFYNAMPRGVPGMTEGTDAEADAKRRALAAQLAVNVIDFRDADADRTVHAVPDDKDQPTADEVFGIERQPFIVEAFHKVFRKDANTVVTYSAIELFNPYETSVKIKGLVLKEGGTQKAFAAAPPDELPAGKRLVIVSTTLEGEVHIPVHTDVHATRKVKELDLSKGVKLYLPRKADGTGDADILIAEVTLSAGEAPEWSGDPAGVSKVWQWDDRPDKARYALGAAFVEINRDYTDSNGGGTMVAGQTNLGKANDKAADVAGGDPTPLYVRNGKFISLGDLFRIFYIGPNRNGQSLPEQLGAGGSIAVGRLDALGLPPGPRWSDYSQQVPPISPACYLSEYLTVLDPSADEIDNDGDGVKDEANELAVAGLLNVNTAPRECLLCLPYMTPAIADQILADLAAKPADRRAFACSGEVLASIRRVAAAKLIDYPPNYKIADGKTTDDGLTALCLDDLTKLQAVYSRIANLITVRSDTFAAYITMMRFKGSVDAASGRPNAVRRYVGVLDRSQCFTRSDWPRVVMFTEIK